MDAKLFVWRNCDYRREVTGGTVGALGFTADAARQAILAVFEWDVREACGLPAARMVWDAYDAEIYENAKTTLMRDLAREPEVETAFIIRGSE